LHSLRELRQRDYLAVGAVILVLCALLQATAPAIDDVVRLYRDARFGEALQLLDKLGQEDLNRRQKIEVQLYFGLNFLALGNEQRAQQAFQGLLDLDPDYQMPTFTSPSARGFFAKVKSSYKIIPQVDHTPPLEVKALDGAEFSITIKRMRPTYNAQMLYRLDARAKFDRVDLTRVEEASYKARLPAALLNKDKPYSLEYYVVVTEDGSTLAQLRSPESPFRVPVSVPIQLQKNVPITQKWWFWTVLAGAAVVVAGGATAAILLTTQQQAPTGAVDLSLQFGSGR
jgi:hypothetical protein